MKLYIDERQAQSATLQIRWAVPNATRTGEGRKQDQQDFVLLAVAPMDGTYEPNAQIETRQLCLALDGRAYVQIRRPGRNRIHAVMLRGKPSDVASAVRSRLDTGAWSGVLLQYDGESVSPGDSIGHIWYDKESDHVDVIVPEECFAPPPPAWESRWVNLIFSSRPIDQCAYRRRRLFAYTVQPLMFSVLVSLVVPLWFVRLFFTAAIAAACALQNVDWTTLIVPFGGTRWQKYSEASWFPPRCENRPVRMRFVYRGDGSRRPKFHALATPVVLLVVALVVLSIVAWSAVRLIFLAGLAVIGIVATAVFGICLLSASIDSLRKYLDRRYLRKLRITEQRGVPPPARVTIRLVYGGVKRAVCQPFAS